MFGAPPFGFLLPTMSADRKGATVEPKAGKVAKVVDGTPESIVARSKAAASPYRQRESVENIDAHVISIGPHGDLRVIRVVTTQVKPIAVMGAGRIICSLIPI